MVGPRTTASITHAPEATDHERIVGLGIRSIDELVE